MARALDLMLHNDKNTPPFPLLQGPVVAIPSDEKIFFFVATTRSNDVEVEKKMNSVSSANSRICITDMGIVSSLGLDVDNACAAARAGLTRNTELKCLNFGMAVGFGKETYEGFPIVVGYTVPSIASGFVGMAKVLLLGSAVLKELWAKRHFSAEELDRTGIHINLSDWFIQDVFASELSQTLSEDEKKPEVLPRPSQQWKKETSEIIEIFGRCVRIVVQERPYYGNCFCKRSVHCS